MASKLLIASVFVFDLIAFGLAVAAEQRRSTVSFLFHKCIIIITSSKLICFLGLFGYVILVCWFLLLFLLKFESTTLLV